MTWQMLFRVANLSAIACWLPLVLAPNSRLTRALTATPAVPALFGLLYAGLLVATYATPGDGGMSSFEALHRAFDRDVVLMLGWVHYLCFDMLIGYWEVNDARRLGIHPLLLAPCLVLTFFFGPTGLLLYLGVRYATRRTLRYDPE